MSNELCKVLGSACRNNGEEAHLSYSADNMKSNFFLTVFVNMANANIVVSHCVDMVERPGTMECLEEEDVQSIYVNLKAVRWVKMKYHNLKCLCGFIFIYVCENKI